MKHHTSQLCSPRHNTRRLLVATLLLALLALLGAQPGFAGAQLPPDPPLVPNSEPEEGAYAGLAGALAATMTMTGTVQAIAEEFNQLPQPALPPDGALLRLDDALAAGLNVIAPGASTRVYLPMVLSSRQPAAAPEPAPTPSPTPSPTPEPAAPADVAVAIWATPSVHVARNGVLAYEIRLSNEGRGLATGVQVVMPYNRQQFTLTHTRLAASKGDWVSAIGADRITVNFGRLNPGEQRTGTLYLRVANNLPDNTMISVRNSFTWSDERNGGQGQTNWAPVLVRGGNVDSPWVWLEVNPLSGRAGTVHTFFTDRFIPGEAVTTWLNTPSGVRALELRGVADSSGRVRLSLVSAGLAEGNYSLVVYGTRSKLTAVAAFVVTR